MRHTLLSFFSSAHNRRQKSVHQLYEHVAYASRSAIFYTSFAVPDTPQGRLEMLIVHCVIALERLKQLPTPADELAQDFVDYVFLQIDHGLREIGIGDLSVGKKIKKIAQDFYGRAELYAQALRERSIPLFATALARNVYNNEQLAGETDVIQLAQCLIQTSDAIKDQTMNDLLNVQSPFKMDNTYSTPSD